MQLRKLINLLIIPLTVKFFACASFDAPKNLPDDASETQYIPHGGWIELEKKSGSKISGELIAISDDTVFVANTKLHAVAKRQILNARLVNYDSKAILIGIWVLTGTLSTISHGWGMFLTAPIWLILGVGDIIYRSFEPIKDYPDEPLQLFNPFARYPQGLPSDIDRSKLKMKYIK